MVETSILSDVAKRKYCEKAHIEMIANNLITNRMWIRISDAAGQCGFGFINEWKQKRRGAVEFLSQLSIGEKSMKNVQFIGDTFMTCLWGSIY